VKNFTIATWNINSVRLRAETVVRFLKTEQPDVLCLQEIKTEDQFFPHEIFRQAGYAHHHVFGQKSYNGVAILSRIPFIHAELGEFTPEDGARFQSVTLETGLKISNFYIPAGGDIPDPGVNPKFKHKLNYVSAVTESYRTRTQAPRKEILVGDFNIAPGENDVWSHKQLSDVVSHTPVEVERLNAFLAAGNFTDCGRALYPESQKLYSWWSYRARDWRASDRGRRLDHIWSSTDLRENLRAVTYHKDCRDSFEGDKPSDHVPVTAAFSFAA
jgi:exodeoxyribonuclease III